MTERAPWFSAFDRCGEADCPCDDPTLCGTREPYVYAWGNNSRRAELKGRPCVIEVAGGRMNTVLIRFVDNGERVTTSRRALRRPANSQSEPK